MANRSISATDSAVRQAAFDWLTEQTDVAGGALARDVLERGFVLQGERVPLVSPQGIFKPKLMELPLSITTTAEGPYDDAFGATGLLKYRYRGTDPRHRDNEGLRAAMRRGVPLVYFHALMPGKYLAIWPVFVVGDDPGSLTFTVEVDDPMILQKTAESAASSVIADDTETHIRRGYITVLAKRRIHQEAFRERVLNAYRQQCALCRLKHEQLLDAAHIVPDSEAEGEPVVSNGIALCKLHHAAFDKYFLSVRPDYVIEIRRDVLVETDGPMLKHGLQGLHELSIQLPAKVAQRPNRELLEARHERFLALSR
jgi:putative restriction endonuclease